jgi:hypothetical protein
VKYPYNKNYKTLKKEIEGDTLRWKDHLCTWVARVSAVKMAVLPKPIYRIIEISVKIPTLFIEIRIEIDPKFHMQTLNLPNSKMNFGQKVQCWRYHDIGL